MPDVSSTPLATKLGIVEGARVLMLNAPSDLALELPPGVTIKRRLRGRADVVVQFATTLEVLWDRMERLAAAIFPAGGLWVAWPKRSSGVPTDVTDHLVREASFDHGLVDNKVCAVDETWTALRLVWRREHRSQAV